MIIICGWFPDNSKPRKERDREKETERDWRKGEKNNNEVTKYMNLTLRKEGTEVKGWMTFIKREDKYLIVIAMQWVLHNIYLVSFYFVNIHFYITRNNCAN